MTRRGRYPSEVRDRAVRLVLEHRDDYVFEWATLRSVQQCLESAQAAVTARLNTPFEVALDQ
jgi:hypothetical protein